MSPKKKLLKEIHPEVPSFLMPRDLERSEMAVKGLEDTLFDKSCDCISHCNFFSWSHAHLEKPFPSYLLYYDAEMTIHLQLNLTFSNERFILFPFVFTKIE